MAHKALIGGVGRSLTGGRCLVNGVGHKIAKGRTLVGGVGYDVAFGPEIYTITLAGHEYTYGGKVNGTYCRVSIAGTSYPPSGTTTSVSKVLQLEAGTVITCTVRTQSVSRYPAAVYLNGTAVASAAGNSMDKTYEYTVTGNATITLKYLQPSSTARSGNIYIVEE